MQIFMVKLQDKEACFSLRSEALEVGNNFSKTSFMEYSNVTFKYFSAWHLYSRDKLDQSGCLDYDQKLSSSTNWPESENSSSTNQTLR